MENKTALEAIAEAVGLRRLLRDTSGQGVAEVVLLGLKSHGYRITKEPDAATSRVIDYTDVMASLADGEISRDEAIAKLTAMSIADCLAIAKSGRVRSEGAIWTQGYPEVSGVYWVTDHQGNDREVVKVSVMGSGVVYSDLAGETHEPITDFKPLCWWYGPIPAPPPPKATKEREESIVRSDDVYPLVLCQGPVWTQGHPEVSGVYWVEDPQGNEPRLVEIATLLSTGVGYWDLEGNEDAPITDFYPTSWWYGPITAPARNPGTDPVQEGVK